MESKKNWLVAIVAALVVISSHGDGARTVLDDGTLAFGPGHASEFMVGANEKALVVGVSGLTWCDFKLRAYQGQGYQDADKAGQSFYCFDDSRIMDVEKRADKGVDYNFCGIYSELQAMMFAGYITGYANEDAAADNLRAASAGYGPYDFECYDKANAALASMAPGAPIPKWLDPSQPADFMSDLAKVFASHDIRCAMDVLVDHPSGDRDSAGHIVSLVGYSLDTTKAATDPLALKGFFVIDSDNDMYNGAGGASAPNSITYCPVKYVKGTYGAYIQIDHVFGTDGVADSVYYYPPKIEGVAKTKTSDLSWPVSCSESVPTASPVAVEVLVVKPEGAFAAPKADVLTGALVKDGQAAGVIQLKVGKASKKGESKVSATVIGLDGKKYTSKAVNVAVGDVRTVTFDVKKLGKMTLTIGANGFSGSLDGMAVTSVDAAAAAATGAGVATFAAGNLSSLSGVLTDYLPADEAVERTDKKWKVAAKAGKLKYVKPNEKKGVAGGLQATGDNIAGLKLTYAPKTQTFKGSFKVWTFDEAKKKLKSVSAKVTGVVINGNGYGQAMVKKDVIGEITVK